MLSVAESRLLIISFVNPSLNADSRYVLSKGVFMLATFVCYNVANQYPPNKSMEMGKKSQTTADSQDPEKDPGFRNIARLIFLFAVLVAAWFLLDWFIK